MPIHKNAVGFFASVWGTQATLMMLVDAGGCLHFYFAELNPFLGLKNNHFPSNLSCYTHFGHFWIIFFDQLGLPNLCYSLSIFLAILCHFGRFGSFFTIFAFIVSHFGVFEVIPRRFRSFGLFATTLSHLFLGSGF